MTADQYAAKIASLIFEAEYLACGVWNMGANAVWKIFTAWGDFLSNRNIMLPLA